MNQHLKPDRQLDCNIFADFDFCDNTDQFEFDHDGDGAVDQR